MAVAAQNRVDDSSSDIRIDSVLNNEYLIPLAISPLVLPS